MELKSSDVKKAHIAVSLILIGGRDWNRTSDTRIFNPLLYRLSYSAMHNNASIITLANIVKRLQAAHYSKLTKKLPNIIALNAINFTYYLMTRFQCT